MGHRDGDVEMTLSENSHHVLFRTSNMEVVSSLIEGQFPDFRSVLPDDHPTKTIVHAIEFRDSVKAVLPFARDNLWKLDLRTEGNQLQIISNSANGESIAKLDADVSGEDVNISLNAQYVYDMLCSVRSDKVVMETRGPSKVCVFKEDGSDAFMHAVMPMYKE